MMKKIILSFLFSVICIASFGQSTFVREGSTSGTNTYTATVTSFTSYTSAVLILKFNNGNTSTATINVNSIGAVNIRKWDGDSWEPLASGDIPADSDVLLVHDNTNSYFKAYVLPEIGQGSTYTAGSGLTLTADQFKLGGTITENTTFSNNGFNVTHASSGTRMGAYRIWATTIGLDGSTSAFIQSGDNTVTTSAASGVDIVGDSVRLATNGSQIRLNTDGSLSIDGDVGTSGQVITSNGAGPLTWETPSGGGLTVGTTTIASGTDTRVLFDNAGVLGEYPITGSTNVVLSNSPTLVTPNLGTPSTLVGTNITGTAAGLTAGTVTTNANLTGHVTSTGNAAVLGSFTSANLSTALTDEVGTGFAPMSRQTINAQVASYTLAVSDEFKEVQISNASANNLTLPDNASVALPVGFQCSYRRTGNGQTTFVLGSGVTAEFSATVALDPGKDNLTHILKDGTNHYKVTNGSPPTTGTALSVLGVPANADAVVESIAASTDGHILRRSGTSLGFGPIKSNFINGTATNDAATAGNIGEEISAVQSTYTNFTTTATYQNITSITLTAGDWDLSAFFTYNSNSATITAASNAIFVISTTTASAAGSTEGINVAYIPQAALLGTSRFSDGITPYRVSIASSTTYYLNAQATFTVGNPQFVGSIKARRLR